MFAVVVTCTQSQNVVNESPHSTLTHSIQKTIRWQKEVFVNVKKRALDLKRSLPLENPNGARKVTRVTYRRQKCRGLESQDAYGIPKATSHEMVGSM